MAGPARHIESCPIRAFECDLHGRLLPRTVCLLLQEAAAAHTAELGVAVEGLLERGVAWVLSQLKLEVHYLAECRLGDSVVSQAAPAGGGELPIVLHRPLRVADGVEAARARAVERRYLMQPPSCGASSPASSCSRRRRTAASRTATPSSFTARSSS